MPFPPSDFLDLSHAPGPAVDLLSDDNTPVWNALNGIAEALDSSLDRHISQAKVSPDAHLGKHVYLGPGTVVEAGATIKGPAWIGPDSTVRAGAYVRENVIAGANVMLGNSCEFKNCIIFDNGEIPHFNYVGDSILGYKAHLGAGVILSNVRLDRQNIQLADPSNPDTKIDTGLRKFGAIVGDRTEVGCNSVLSPGSILGPDCILYPGTHWHGVLDKNHIVKLRQSHEITERRSD
ncbi:MAG: UDP-N-acetylglucosamine diphosphorylase [Verrucomicrobiota bacterium]